MATKAPKTPLEALKQASETPAPARRPPGRPKGSKTTEKAPSEAPKTAPKPAPAPALDAPTLAAQKELASRILARRRLLPFVQRVNPKYQAGWVHEDICERLERFSAAVAAGLSPRLMILMPPRHGKSELASRSFPPWHLGRHPDHEFIACSYNVSLAMSFSRKVKEVMLDTDYAGVFQTRLDPNNQSTEEWGIAGTRGGYVAAGVGGGITGKGAHVLMIDDPVKSAEDADSADYREKLRQWYLSTAYSRLSPGGGVLIIQTCWHDDDLAGWLQEQMRAGSDDENIDQFEVVKYPAIAEADEWRDDVTHSIIRVEHTDASQNPMDAILRASAQGLDPNLLTFLRARGDALHPARYDIAKLNRIKAQNGGGRWWSALYQQNPVPDDGSYFLKEQFRRASHPPAAKCNVFIAFDFAISEKKQNDYTVGVVGLQDEHDVLHVAEVVRFKSGDAFFIVETILNLAARWYSPSLIIGLEDGQIYRALQSLLQKRMKERRMYPAIEVLRPITDKMARARPLQGRMQQGMVSFHTLGEWFGVVQMEMLRFPAGAHDDCVDALAWLTQLVLNRQPPQGPRAPVVKSWRDKLSGRAGSIGHMAA